MELGVEVGRDVANDLHEIRGLEIEVQPAGRDPRDVEQVVHEEREAGRLPVRAVDEPHQVAVVDALARGAPA